MVMTGEQREEYQVEMAEKIIERVLVVTNRISLPSVRKRPGGSTARKFYPPVPKDPTWEAFTQEYMGEE